MRCSLAAGNKSPLVWKGSGESGRRCVRRRRHHGRLLMAQKDDVEALPLPEGSLGLPVLGETLSLFSNPDDFGLSRYQKFGNVWKTSILGVPTVMVYGEENVSAVLKEEGRLVSASWPDATKILVGPKSLNLLEGEEHNRVKTLVNVAFSQEAIGVYLPRMQKTFESFLKSWAVDLATPFLSVEEATTMACAAFGTCLLGLNSSKETGQDLRALFDALQKGFQTVPLNLPFTAFREAVKARESFLDKVREAQQKLEAGNDIQCGLDFMTKSRDEDEDEDGLTQDELEDSIMALVFGNSSMGPTMAKVLQYTCDDYVLHALRKEQDSVIESFGESISSEALRAMPYCQAVTKEILRISPVVPVTMKSAIETFELDGFKIPKGWQVFCHLGDSATKYNNDEFKPERWLSEPAQDSSGGLENALSKIRTVADSVVQFCIDAYQIVMGNRIAKLSSIFALSVALTTALLNTFFLGYMHQKVLPSVTSEVSVLLEREISVGRIHWISPVGLLGCAPLTSIGPVYVGPGPVEKSSATVPTLRAGINVAQSIVRGQIVLWLNCLNPDVDLAQASNFSWFGHPQDTTPSSKDYVPGLTKRLAEQEAANKKNNPGTYPLTISDDVERPTLQWSESLLRDRRCSHYSSSTSSSCTKRIDQKHDKLPQNRVAQIKSSQRFQATRSKFEDTECVTLVRDPEAADMLHGNPVVGATKGRSFLLSVPGWQVVGPAGSISMAPRGFGHSTHNSTDSSPGNDIKGNSQGGGSSQSQPSEPKVSGEPSGRRRRRIREKRETSHSGRSQIARRSQIVERRKKPTIDSRTSEETHTQTSTVLDQSIPLDNQARASASSPTSQVEDATKVPKKDIDDELKPERAATRSAIKASAPDPVVHKPPRQNPATKSVEVEVVLPGKELDLAKSGNWKPGHQRLSASGDVTGEEVKELVGAGWHQLTRHIKPPEVALGKLSVQKGLLYAHMAGEVIPREIVDVNGSISFGSGYNSLSVDVKGKPHVRNPESLKCTMLSPNAQRHLRFITPGVNGGYDHVFPGDITEDVIKKKKASEGDTLEEGLSMVTSATPLASASLAQSADTRAIGKGKDGGGSDRYSSLAMSSAFQGALWDVEGGSATVKGSPKKEKVITPSPPRELGERRPTPGKPMGGDLRVTVDVKDMLRDDMWPQLDAKVFGKNLHGPLIDRILEIPMDIHEGRANGYIQIQAFDTQTWVFPKIDANIRCTNVDFHFWDAPDHLSKCNFDLIMENSKLYFHNATGQYGSVPLSVAGDMDLDPDTGHYRLTATVPPVEVNAIRASLGVRPLPHPVAGAVYGVLHCNGPLEEPIFSGRGEVLRPSIEAIEALEDSHAKTALQMNPGAVAVFDKVPFTSGSAVFTHNTSTDIFTLHDSVAIPVGGGELAASGQMWVAPIAEKDPQAIAMNIEGHGINAKEVMKRYLSETVEVPEVLDPGATDIKATMRGSHAAPKMSINWQAPSMNASGSAELSRKHWKATATAPTFDISGTVHTEFPDFELTKSAYSQAEMNALTTPSIVGVDTDITTKGCDVMPLLSNTSAVDRVASGQALRLKLSGQTQISARRTKEEADPSQAVFSGDISLQGLRVNQLNLARQLGGSLDFSPSGFKLLAKGQRADELLNIEFSLPQEMWMEDGLTFGKPSSLQDENPFDHEDLKTGKEFTMVDKEKEDKGGYFSLRQGKLQISTEVSSLPSRVIMRIRGLELDDLELASLRGNLQDAFLDLNFGKREGRGEINMLCPRYSGLMGEYLTGGFRWEKDVVHLEKMILQQQRSRYEVEGEYTLPPNLALPFPEITQRASVMDDKPRGISKSTGAGGPQHTGRWRIQVEVPNADVEEIIPAGQLVSRATSFTQKNYDEAKTTFLDGLGNAGISSGQFGEELKKLIMPETSQLKDAPEGSAGSALPGLQTLRGKWKGTMQAWGGGEGASRLQVKARGDSWQWGEYELDKAVAIGNYHSVDGIHVDELSLGTGEAQLLIRGDLLGPKQDATVVLNDFPAALLSPIYRAVPALQNAVPAVTERVSLNRFVDSWENTFKSLGMNFWKEDTPMQRLTKGSPVNGLLYVRGSLGGSAESPEGVVNVQLYDGALGPTRLAVAKAEVTLNKEQEIQFNLSASPDESSGYIEAAGTLPFLQENGIRGNMSANVHVKDGGMRLISAVLPDFRWEAGMADLTLRASGPVTNPEIKGGANISKATMYSPNLKYPLKNVYGDMTIENECLTVDKFEAKAGNHGHINARGFLPMDVKSPRDVGGLFSVEISGLELKLSSVYTGRLDSILCLTRSMKEPVVSGVIELSRGTMQLQYGALGSSEDKESGTPTLQTSGAFAAEGQTLGLGSGVNMMYQPPDVVESPLQGVQLQGLELVLGSELRFQVPLMVNLAISGSIEVSGGLDPGSLVPSGTIQIDGGMVNLLATQLRMARADQPGRITFVPEQGLDPNVDITFTSAAEGFRAICKGRASTWQDNIIVADGTDEVQLSQAAKMFQKRLDDVLVAENGQLAFVNLAASTMATVTPRLDTQGQIGAARWRLVSAPNIPDLLTNADRLDLHNLVTNLITGTEVEVQFGPTVQAVVTHKMRGADYGTQWNLSLNLTENFRLTATVANSPPTTRTIMLEYRSEGRPRLL